MLSNLVIAKKTHFEPRTRLDKKDGCVCTFEAHSLQRPGRCAPCRLGLPYVEPIRSSMHRVRAGAVRPRTRGTPVDNPLERINKPAISLGNARSYGCESLVDHAWLSNDERKCKSHFDSPPRDQTVKGRTEVDVDKKLTLVASRLKCGASTSAGSSRCQGCGGRYCMMWKHGTQESARLHVISTDLVQTGLGK
jgi:hypothetical protein